jgi:two-component system response regulator (stage 0 sporulation protein A)
MKMKKREMITKAIKKLGIPAHLSGYNYIRCGVEIMVEEGHLRKQITKYLYPKIAEKFETTPNSVERCIRHAIDVSLSRCDKNFLNEIFEIPLKYKPTNSEFITSLADYVSENAED